MIIYYSATGNTKRVAEQIALATDDRAVDMMRLLAQRESHDYAVGTSESSRSYVIGSHTSSAGASGSRTSCAGASGSRNRKSSVRSSSSVNSSGTKGTSLGAIELEPGEQLGIASPVYCWGLPAPVASFLEKAIVMGYPSYTFTVVTYGSTTGAATSMLRSILSKRGVVVDASYSIKFPDTWTPIFDLSDPAEVQAKLDDAEYAIGRICGNIRNRDRGNHDNAKVPSPIGQAVWHSTYPSFRNTRHLRVDDTCIGCGLCAKSCPVGAIEMQDGRPVWVKSKCAICLRCLHRCPKFAIQYGNNTRKHGQYVNPYTEL